MVLRRGIKSLSGVGKPETFLTGLMVLRSGFKSLDDIEKISLAP
jgi:hypothetical protein